MIESRDNSIIRNCVLHGDNNCEIVSNYGSSCCKTCIVARYKGLGFKYLICAYKRYVEFNKHRMFPYA